MEGQRNISNEELEVILEVYRNLEGKIPKIQQPKKPFRIDYLGIMSGGNPPVENEIYIFNYVESREDRTVKVGPTEVISDDGRIVDIGGLVRAYQHAGGRFAEKGVSYTPPEKLPAYVRGLINKL